MREWELIVEFRDTRETVALYTDTTDIERKLKKLKTYTSSIPYYNMSNGKIVGVDLYFDKSARITLRKLAKTHQLPLF
ncbi:hypothetical protein ACFLWO_04705 [Chloroflexota bacterium]